MFSQILSFVIKRPLFPTRSFLDELGVCVVLHGDGKLGLANCLDERRLYVKDCFAGILIQFIHLFSVALKIT